MEDILSSIKRIISEDGDTAPRQRRAPARALHAVNETDPRDEVLELSDPMPEPRAPDPKIRTTTIPSADAPTADSIVSSQTAAATRGALDALSRLLVKPEPATDGTLEGLVREMLRPMLREWIDANLPQMVEGLVAREIKRITGEAR